MSSLNKIRILENDEQKKTNPNSNEAFELGFVDSLKRLNIRRFLYFLTFILKKLLLLQKCYENIPSDLITYQLEHHAKNNKKLTIIFN